MRKRIFDVIQIGNKNDLPSTLFDYFITFVIFLNLFVTFTLTFTIAPGLSRVLKGIELVTMIIFTVEYLLRIATADYLYPNKKKKVAILLFMVSFYGIVDLLTILPYWLPIETIYGGAAFRIIRIFRIFHLFRVNSQSDAYNVIITVLKEKKGQLLSSISLIAILMLSASFLMYSVEHNAQPEVFDNAFSGLWWSVSTVLTVGYGDIYPITVIGRIMAILISLLGVMITAIPTGILSAGFSEKYHEGKCNSGHNDLIIEVSQGNAFIGKRAGEIAAAYNLPIVAIIREGSHMQVESTVIQAGDKIIC